MNLVKDQEKAAERRIVSISAVPAGQYRSILQADDTGQVQGTGNACGVFALMSDGTIEIYSTENNKWTLLPPVPKRF